MNKRGLVDLGKKGRGGRFIGTPARFSRGSHMAAVATDLPFLTSGARVGMPRDMLAPKGIELTRLPGRLIGG